VRKAFVGRAFVVGSAATGAALAIVVAVWVVTGGSCGSSGGPGWMGDRGHRGRPSSPVGTVAISGIVVDRFNGSIVADATVVLANNAGEHIAKSRPDGTFELSVPRGDYRAFVRDDRVISIGRIARVPRLRATPRWEFAGVLDLELVPILAADRDTSHLELGVVRAATIEGVVLDGRGNRLGGVPVRATTDDGRRPAIGGDVAVSDAEGHFALRVPSGRYIVEASNRKLGLGQSDPIEVAAGDTRNTEIALGAGCTVSGKVVRADGSPSQEGAIEVSRDTYVPAWIENGRIDSDGTFSWSSLVYGRLAIRAWPWKSAPSPTQVFDCREGARYDNVVFRIPDAEPDLSGTIVDAMGAPVPFAFIDIKPLDPFENGQQERADASGRWEVYAMPSGRFEIAAAAPGRGIALSDTQSPRRDLELKLGGTGRIAGTVSGLVDGSFEVAFGSCGDDTNGPLAGRIAIAREPRIAVVRGGRFAIDAPACQLELSATLRDKTVPIFVHVVAGATAFVELDFGLEHDKAIRGNVRDERGRPVRNARVTASHVDHPSATATTDEDGTYRLRAYSGATLTAGDGSRTATAVVGRANVREELVDLVLNPAQ
jgi:hypothetical protein